MSDEEAHRAGNATAVTASLRLHGELIRFLPPGRRAQEFSVGCAADATIKHVVEALGVPHTEAALILVNGAVADFGRRVHDGDRIAIYPLSAITATGEIPARGPTPERFIADAHLGGLARLLRLAGFDTRYDNALDDAAIVAVARREGRCVLSRDVELLKRRELESGCYVHALKPAEQFGEIVRRLGLADHVRPFSRCLECNALLRPVAGEDALKRLPQRVREEHDRFTTCDACGRLYWEGSHWRRMQRLLQAALGRAAEPV